MNKSTFIIRSSKYKTSFGTGFCIDKDDNGSFLLTCQHVIESCGEDFLTVEEKRAEVQKSSNRNRLIDLAVIYVQGLDAQPLKLSSYQIQEDDEFYIYGFKPHKTGYKQEELTGSIKKISKLYDEADTIDSYELSMYKEDFIEKGYSGSAIVSKLSGQVVAVATDRTSTGKQAYAIPLNYLKEVWSEFNLNLFDVITPFVGLSAFGQEDRAYFFGRDKETEEILRQLKSTSIMAIIGDSGSGKSSLVKAGVIPNYIDNSTNENLHIVEIRPARNPFVELARCVGDICEKRDFMEADIGYFVDKIKSQESQNIQSVFERLFKDKDSELLFYIDQFEELFTLCDKGLQEKFIECILYLIENQTIYLKIKIIFSMRRDYYNLLKKYETFYKNIDTQTYLVRRMSDKNLKEVIERPLEILSVEKSEIEQLSNTILWDLGDESKEITLLQIALTETWNHKDTYKHDLMETYVKIGRVTGALSHLATNAMKSLDEKDQELFKYIFVRIVKFNDMGGITRRLADRDEFSDEAWALVQKLASVHGAKQTEQKELGRLLKLKSSKENEDEEVIELIHEALTTQWDTYVEWIRSINVDNRKRIHNVLIGKSKLYKKTPQQKFLLSGYALEEGRKLLDEEYLPYLSSFEKEFIEKSEKSETRTIFWKRFGLGTLVVLLGLSGYLGFEANRVKERATLAKNHAEEISKKLIKVVTDFGNMSIENHVRNDPNSFKMFSFIVEHFKESENKKVLDVVATSYVGMGVTYNEIKEYDKAIKVYKKAIEINPNITEAYNNMGISYYPKKEYDKAIEAYKKAIEINPNKAEFYSNMGNSYYPKKEYDKAIEAYKKAIKLSPNSNIAYSNMGNSYDAKKEYDKAIEAYKKAITLNSNFYIVYFNMGMTYFRLGKFDESSTAYIEAIKLNPIDSSIYSNLFVLELIKNKPFNKELEKKYIELFKEKKETFIYYEMLKIFQNIVQKKEANTEQWKEKYINVSLGDWSFNELDSWIAKIEECKTKQELKEALNIFKNHKKD